MCRNIRPLFNFEPPASQQEIHEAALQFVRKLSGFQRPSRKNEAAFNTAVTEISAVVTRMLDGLETSAAPRDRQVEADRRRNRNRERFVV